MLIIVFFVLCVGLLRFMVFRIFNVIFWWRVFLLMDMFFLLLCKETANYSSVLNYFLFQECLGLIFLLLNNTIFQYVVVMIKIGLVPFHYWLFLVVGGIDGWLIMWFLTFQKVPYISVLMVTIFSYAIFFLVLGFFFCYFHLFVVKTFKFMLLLNSVESFNWIIFGYLLSLFNGVVCFFYYFFIRLFLVPFWRKEVRSDFDWLIILIYMNVPLGVIFFVKIFVLISVLRSFRLWVVLVLFLIFVNFYSLLSWLIKKRIEENFVVVKSRLVFCLWGGIILVVLYRFSKIYYNVLIGRS